MSAAIEVLEVKPIDGAGNLKAYAKVKLGAVIIHGCRIVQQPGQRAWVSLPQQKSGERYYPIVEITRKELLDQVRDAVIEAWEQSR